MTNEIYPRKKLIQDIVLVVIIGLVPFLWYKGGIIIAGSDAVYPLWNPVKFYLSRFFTWDPRYGTGVSGAIHATSLFFHLPQAVFYLLGASVITSQKLLFSFWFTGILGAIYYFVATVQPRPNRLQRLSAMCFFAFNPLLFNVWEVGKAANISAYIGMPVLLAIMIRGLDGRLSKLKAALYFGLFSIVVSEMGASPSIFGVPVMLLGLYALFYLIYQLASTKNIKAVSGNIVYLVSIAVIYILMNAFWWLPYLQEILVKLRFSVSSGLEAFHLTNWLKGISTHTSILNVARLQGAWDWYYSIRANVPYVPYADTYFSNPFFLFWSTLIPVLAYSAVIFRRNLNTLFFAFIALLATLFGCGAHLPTGKYYLMLTMHLPFFSVFRSPYYKFSLITAFAYAYLVSVTLSVIYTKAAHLKRGSIKKIAAVCIGGVIALNLFYNYPMFNGQVIRVREEGTAFSVGNKIPPYVYEFAQFMDKKDPFYRIISLPQLVLNGFKWGYIGPPHILNLISQRGILHGLVASAYNDHIRNVFYESLRSKSSPYTGDILKLLNVKYILFLEDAWYEFFGVEGSIEYISDKLYYQFGLKPIKQFNKWQLYEITDKPDLIQASSSLSLVVGGLESLTGLTYSGLSAIQPLLFSYQKENFHFINEGLEAEDISEIIFFDRKTNDFIFDMIASDYMHTYQEQEIFYDKGLAVEIDVKKAQTYQLWIQRNMMERLHHMIPVQVDGELVNPAEGKSEISQGWVKLAEFHLDAGKHEIEPVLTDQEKSHIIEKAFSVLIMPKETYDMADKKYNKRLDEYLKQAGYRYFMHSSNMRQVVTEDITKRNKNIAKVELMNFFRIEKSRKDAEWLWLRLHDEKSIVIVNESDEAIATNLSFTVYSYKRPRDLHVRLNNQFLGIKFIPEDKEVALVFKGLEIQPGINHIYFYTPSRKDKRFNRDISFGFKDIKVGSLENSGTFYVPEDNIYVVNLYPYPIKKLPHEGIKISIDNKERFLKATAAKGSYEYARSQLIRLSAGYHEISFMQPDKSLGAFIEIKSVSKEENRAIECSYERKNPTYYTASIKSEKPVVFVSFKESFDSHWEAVLQRPINTQVEHFVANGYANGWKIKSTTDADEKEIHIISNLQRLFYQGIFISTLSIIVAVALLILHKKEKGSQA